jgi:general secretion pathway protein F
MRHGHCRARLAVTALAQFRLRVVEANGVATVLELASTDAAAAQRRAAQLGFTVLAVEPAAAARSLSFRASDFSLLLFNQELLALLEAGLHLNEALGTLLAKESHSGAARLLQALVNELSRGRSFSDALGDHPERFPAVYVAVLRAAERTGDLPRALSRFIAYQRQFDLVRKQLLAACIYPAMLMLVGGSVTLFLLAYVVPRFATVYASAGREMPATSAALLALGTFISSHAWLLLGLTAVLALLAATVLRRAGWQGAVNVFLRLPGIAARADQFRLARFYRATGLLLTSGVALPRAMGMVGGLLSPAQQRRLVLAVGERSGQLADMLERSARFHDDDLERWLDWASRLLEPLLMIAIGAVVGGVVLLLYLPIFELAGGL